MRIMLEDGPLAGEIHGWITKNRNPVPRMSFYKSEPIPAVPFYGGPVAKSCDFEVFDYQLELWRDEIGRVFWRAKHIK